MQNYHNLLLSCRCCIQDNSHAGTHALYTSISVFLYHLPNSRVPTAAMLSCTTCTWPGGVGTGAAGRADCGGRGPCNKGEKGMPVN